jgi:hypothetical protein
VEVFHCRFPVFPCVAGAVPLASCLLPVARRFRSLSSAHNRFCLVNSTFRYSAGTFPFALSGWWKAPESHFLNPYHNSLLLSGSKLLLILVSFFSPQSTAQAMINRRRRNLCCFSNINYSLLVATGSESTVTGTCKSTRRTDTTTTAHASASSTVTDHCCRHIYTFLARNREIIASFLALNGRWCGVYY